VKVGAILPHLRNYGGVKRFLEVGNVFIKRGVEYTIFVGQRSECEWFDFRGRVENWSDIEADYILIGDTPSFKILPTVKGRIFIYVIAGGHFLDGYKRMYGKYSFIVNNRVFLKYFPNSFLIEGGINTVQFFPKKRKVLFYDTDRTMKGATYIKSQLGDLKNIELIGLKDLSNSQIAEAYRKGDIYVAWENREGWSNMAVEALRSGLAVVTNGIGCEPFMDKVIQVKDLRKFFENPMGEFSWEIVVDKLMKIFKEI